MEPFTSSSSDFTTPVQTTPPKKSKKGLIAILVVILVLALGGFWFYRGYQTNKEKAQEEPPVVPTETVVEEVTPAPEKEVTPTTKPVVKGAVTSAHDLQIEVLNGTGEEGVAAKMRDFLAGKGYKNIDVGNADNFDYQGVEVRIKDDYQKYLETLENDLKESYTLSTDSGKLVTADSDVDATIIVGK